MEKVRSNAVVKYGEERGINALVCGVGICYVE